MTRFLTLSEKVDMGNGDLYEMMTYLLVVLISAVVMTVWLKRRGRRKRK
jgi:antibiotic biosynthesis monooxygenase (ABM) superfamily enzyme